MPSQDLTAEIVRAAIERAFAEVPYPGDDRIVRQSECMDLERDDVERAFKGKDWRDVLDYPVEFLRYHNSALSDFTPEGYQFYLPAYLIATAENYAHVDVVSDAVVFSLKADGRSPESLAFYQERMMRLTSAQRKAIKSFLEYLKAQHPGDDPLGDIDKALEGVSPQH